MQTNFKPKQLKDPRIAEIDKILRKCVHCGFCTATCPTYVLLGDERDSPRGRIYLMKEMFERGRRATPVVQPACRPLPVLPVVHDHLPERRRLHAPRRPRARTYRGDRPAQPQGSHDPAACWRRRCPIPTASAWRSGRRAWRGRSPACCAGSRRRSWWRCSTWRRQACCAAGDFSGPGTAATAGERRKRVILLAGCAQQVLRPEINDATIRLLARRGVDVEVAPDAGCCGALVHHMGARA